MCIFGESSITAVTLNRIFAGTILTCFILVYPAFLRDFSLATCGVNWVCLSSTMWDDELSNILLLLNHNLESLNQPWSFVCLAHIALSFSLQSLWYRSRSHYASSSPWLYLTICGMSCMCITLLYCSVFLRIACAS